MKNSIRFTLVFQLLFLCSIFSFTQNCNRNFRFTNIQNGQSFYEGTNLFVKIDANKPSHFEYMTLFINNNQGRKEIPLLFEEQMEVGILF